MPIFASILSVTPGKPVVMIRPNSGGRGPDVRWVEPTDRTMNESPPTLPGSLDAAARLRTRPVQTLLFVLIHAVTSWMPAFNANAAPGDLDTTFGGGTGKVTTNYGTNSCNFHDVVVQADGKIVATGTVNDSTDSIVTARYNANGTLDSTFSGDGLQQTDIGISRDSAYAIALQSDGKIVVGGSSRSSTNDNFALIRYNTNGTLDTTFNSTGTVTTDMGTNNDYVWSLAIQSDRKILAAGYAGGNLALARYNENGTLDTGFGSSGKITTDLGSGDQAYDMIIQADGKIVVAGQSDVNGTNDFALVRYLADGTLDTAFNGNGMVITPIGTGSDEGQSVALQSDGKIIVAGRTYDGAKTDFAVVRYNANGTPDTSFGAAGVVVTPLSSDWDEAHAVHIQSDGKIIASGFATIGGAKEFAVVRYNTNGTLDGSFGTDGVKTALLGSSSEAYCAALQSNGRIVLAGQAWDGSRYDFAVARFLGDPSPEIALSGNGTLIADDDVTPSTTDHSDFSSATILGGTAARTFTVQNTGDGDLTLSAVSVNGANAADFIVTLQPSAVVAPGGSTTFQVVFDPAAPGVRQAVLSFVTNDADEASFDFAVRGVGTGLPAPGQLVVPGHLSTGLKGWWRLDETTGSNRADSSGNNNHLTPINGPTRNTENYWSATGGSAQLSEPSDQELQISNATQTGLGFSGANTQFTLAAWVKVASFATSYPAVIFKQDASAHTGYGMALLSGGGLRLNINDNTYYDVSSDWVKTGRWQHVAISLDTATNEARYYVDGNLVASRADVTADPLPCTKPFRIGGEDNTVHYFNGQIHDAAVWSRVLAPQEVKSLASGIDVSTAYRPGNVSVAPTAWWKLNELSSGTGAVTRADSAAVSHPLTDNNTVGAAGGYLDGSSARFARSSAEYLTAIDSVDWNIGSGSGSISTWARFDSMTPGVHYPLFCHNQDVNNYMALYLVYQGGRHWLTLTEGISNTIVIGLLADWQPKAGPWYHIAWTKSGNEHRFYVDGVQVGGAQNNSSPMHDYAGPVMIGRLSDGSEYLDGQMADLAFWKGYALSSAEIKALAAALPVQKAGIVSYWPLDEASGTRSDAVGTNHLAPINSPASAAGLVGTAADFESTSSQYLKITSGAQTGLNPTSALSVFGWVRPESVGSRQVIASRGYGNSGFALSYGSSGTSQFDTGPGGAASTSTVSIGNWSFLGGVWDGARQVYFNAAHEITDPSTGPSTTTHDFTLGANDLPGEFTDGLVDEVVVARRWFRDEEIKALYLRGLGGIPAMSFLAAQETGGVTITADGGGSVGFTSQAVETTSAAKTITIWNTSDQTLTSLAVALTGADAANFVLNTTGTATSLAAGASTTFTVVFAPQIGGPCSANVQISSSASVAANPFDITLSGTGTADVPVITSLSSHNAKPGDSVTITGSGFSAVSGNNAVWFGAAKGTVMAASTTQLTVTVPTGATAGLVTVSVHGYTAFSKRVFTPSYTGPGFLVAGMEFYESGRVSTGSGPLGNFIADVDLDGKPDLLSANGTANSLSVFLNMTAGTGTAPAFAAKVDFAAAGNPEGVVAVDITGDGKPEMLASGELSGEVHVLRNDSTPGSISSGSFTALSPATGGTYPQRTISCDLDGDGLPDLITAMAQGSSVGIHRQTAPGVFAARQLVSTDSSDTRRIVAADFNSDGKTDLAVSHASGEVVLLRNTSTAGVILFTKDPALSVSAPCFSLAAADLDADGQDDLIAGMSNSSFVRVWRNTSGGTALAFGTPIDLAVEGGVYSVAVGDLNGDGKVDIAAAHGSSAGKVSLLPNTHVSGALSSGSFGTRTFLNTGGTPQHVSIGDLNGDLLPEIVVTMGGTSELAVWRSGYVPSPTVTAISSSSARPGQSITITGTNFSTTPANNIVWFGSVRGVVTAATGTQLTVTVPVGAQHAPVTVSAFGLAGSSRSFFTPGYQGAAAFSGSDFSAATTLSAGYMARVTAGDFDGDGAIDLVTGNSTDGTITLFRNQLTPGSLGATDAFPTSLFAPSTTSGATISSGGTAYEVKLADMDVDGRLDLIAPLTGTDAVRVWRKSASGGSYAFDSGVNFPTAASPQSCAVADIDGDGQPDIITGHSGSQIAVLRNTSTSGVVNSSSFAAAVTFATDGTAEIVAVGDLDGDGKPEIIAATPSGKVCIFRNQSTVGVIDSSSFASRIDISTGETMRGVRLGDLDGDGDLDLITLDYYNNDGNEIPVLRNKHTGGVLSATSFDRADDLIGNGSDRSHLDLADMDGDGKLDVAGVTGLGDGVVWRNLSPVAGPQSISFDSRLAVTMGIQANGGVCADFDGDGRPDIAGVRDNAGQLTLVRNIHAFGTPQIAVEQPVSTVLTDGVSSLSLGNVNVGQTSAAMTVTIRNTGSADLENLALSLSGAQMAEFSLGTLPVTVLAPGASTTFTVTFSPTSLGTRSAALQIASNVSGATNPFDITLTGSGINGTLTTNFTSGSTTGLTTNGFTATGSMANLLLGYAPVPFSLLTVVNNTSANPISGTFTNLAQGQSVTLVYNTISYDFFADYFGGTGNDLVLVLKGPGVLDYAFGGTGKVVTPVGNGNEQVNDVAVQPDGKIVAVGSSYNGSSDDFAVVRYNADGTLDSGFGSGGKVTTSIGNQNDQAYGVAIQPDGKIVVAGLSTNDGVQHIAVVRYTSSGVPDNAFSSDGKVVTPVGTASEGRDIVLRADGKIFVGGDYWNGTDTDFMVVAYNEDGSIFTDYGGGGGGAGIITIANPGRHDEATCMALMPDGRIVIGGYYQSGTDRVLTVFRLAPHAAPDSSFGSNGWVTTQIAASDFGRAVAVQPDGKILLAGHAPGAGGHDALVLRYNWNGVLDSTFDGDGIASLSFGSFGDYALGLALQWDGKILVSGYTEDGVGENAFLARLNPSGSLDTSFHGDGKVTMAIAGVQYQHAKAMSLQPDGRIVLAGFAASGGNNDFALSRYLVETTLPANFSSSNTRPLNTRLVSGSGLTLNPSLSFAPAPGTELWLVNNAGPHVIQAPFTNIAQGAVVPLVFNNVTYSFTANYSGGNGNDLTLLLAGPGGADPTFNGSGRHIAEHAGQLDFAYDIAMQSDGKVLTAGRVWNGGFNFTFTVARHNTDGSLDSSFGGGTIGFGGSQAFAVIQQPDGKILAGGNGNWDFKLVRCLPNGALDNSFGSGGTVFTDFGGTEDCLVLAVQKDGKILAAGITNVSGGTQLALARHFANGELEAAFGTNGRVLTSLPGDYGAPTGIVIQEDGKIVLSAITGGASNALYRYNPDGTLDSSFGTAGRLDIVLGQAYSGGPDVCLQHDGKLVVAGAIGMDFGVARYHANGTLDTSFGIGGTTVVSFTAGRDFAVAVQLQADGKIVAAGRVETGVEGELDYGVVRLLANGALDTSFHGDGKATIRVGEVLGYCAGMTLSPAGKIVLAGYSYEGAGYESAQVARLATDSAVEVAFSAASDVPLRFNGLDGSNRTLSINLNYPPTAGTRLKVFDNTGLQPVLAPFANLAQGQMVTLNHSSVNYDFVVNYFGGDGNDLTLEWANTKLAAFGSNLNGQLGITGTATQANVPTQVVATAPIYQKTILSMSAGEAHSLAVCSDGTVAAWGSNANGQLGNGTTTSATTPVAVTMSGVLSGKKVVAVAAGGQHSLALCSDGTLAAWGDGSFGQIGDGGVLDRTAPVLVSTAGALSGKRVIAISAGANHSAALCSDGTVVCWGGNTNGELGDGSNTQRNVPVAVSVPLPNGVLLGRTAVEVACGQNHTLALLADGAVAAWGLNASGQLGNGSTAASNMPVLVSTGGILNGKRVVEIEAGGSSSLARSSDGVLAAWGMNDSGQLGVNSATTSFTTPQLVLMSGVLSGKTVTRLFAGEKHAGAVCSDGTLATWGEGTGGELGDNAVLDSLQPVLANTSILGGTDVFVEMSSGAFAGHSLALIGSMTNEPLVQVESPATTLLSDSTSNQIVFGTTLPGTVKTRVVTIRNTGTQTLSGVGVTITGSGANPSNFAISTPPAATLAPGDATSFTLTFAPSTIGSKTIVLEIASNIVGTANPFSIGVQGTVLNTLAASYTTGQEIPAAAAGFTASGKTVNFSLNYAPPTGTTLMVVNNTGAAFISGAFSNLTHGQVVTLTNNSINYNFVANYFGGDGNDLVLHWAATRLLAWGANATGALGNNSTVPALTPVAVTNTGVLNGKTIIAVASGERHSLAVCSDGALAAWGANNAGQLGDATNSDRLVPVLVSAAGALNGKKVIAAAAGYDFSIALCSDGTLVTFGENSGGQLGNNSNTPSNVPVTISSTAALSGKAVVSIAAGYDFGLASCADGTVVAWGQNGYGQFGNNTINNSLVPVTTTISGVLNGKTVRSVAAGNFHSLAICTDGTLAGWGDNSFGELGDGTNDSSLLPVLVTSSGGLAGRTPVQIAASMLHSAALCSDGSVVTWGDNSFGQLGLIGIESSFSPVIAATGGVMAGRVAGFLGGGQMHHVISVTDGYPAAWGDNSSGQLGNGVTLASFVPVAVSTTAFGAGERVVRVSTGSTGLHSLGIVAMPLASGGAPVVSTNAAESINKTSATLKGLVNASGTATTAWFEYGLTTSYGNVIPLVPQSVGSGSTSQTFTQALSGLEPNTPYHYRIVASNTNGTVTGDDFSFTTLPDPPLAVTTSANTLTNTTATLTGTVNPTGRATTIYFEFGTTTLYGNTTAPQNIAVGSSNVNVIAPVSGLTLGTTYHFRLVAQNAGGTAFGDDVVFTTTSISPPTITGLSATSISINSATLNGGVNPNGAITTVFFEYGLTTTYTNATGTTGLAAGTLAVNVPLGVSALTPATTYHYRLVAENSAGITRSADATFTTLPLPPIVETHAAAALSTTSARLNGKVNAQNGSAVVTIEWGTDGVSFPNSLTATPSPVTGSTLTDVSVDLANLAQFTTYHYRVKAVSAGGATTGGVLTFQPAIISGLTQQFPNAPPASNGSLTVTLAPTGLLSGWRFVGEHRWRASGDTATGLVHGSRVIEFRPVPGYLQPGTDTVNVTSTGQIADYEYYATPSSGTGGILVVLKPDTLAQAVNVADRGQWRLFGETTWRDSATTASSLPAGSYLVECKAVSGYSTPVLVNIAVSSGQTVNPTIVYADAFSPTGTPPTVLSFGTVSTDATKPYGYVGQIRSNSGVGTGFAVKSRVVATAAHVVFDEGSQSSVQGLQWLPQEDAGGHEPRPVTPRGYYLIDGYATQRATETPGSFSLASRQKDVAALYFINDTDAARGGFAGFLASDLTNNEFLISSAQKMLVGYPVDGIATLDQGRMHATPATNLSFSGLTDRVFATTGIRSTGGNSGGPLCVQHTNGNWYPAAIYLGGATQSIVRAIDSTVIQLFDTAQQSGIDDQGYTGGGITHSGYSTPGGTSGKGAAIINITPAGSGWRPLGSTKPFTPSGNIRADLMPGTMYVEFAPVVGYQTPVHETILIVANSIEPFSITFLPSQTPQESWRQTYFGTTANSGNGADGFDFDNDGFTNAQEYTAGTNPTLGGDFFKITDTQRTASTFTASTAGKAGRTYTLQRSTNLIAWTNVTSQGPLATDSTVTLLDGARPADAAFYRILVTGP